MVEVVDGRLGVRRTKIEARSWDTEKKACDGGSELCLLGSNRGFFGAGGHTNGVLSFWDGDVGVWHSSTTSSFSISFVVPRSCLKVLVVGTTVRMGVIGRNSSKISRPICFCYANTKEMYSLWLQTVGN